MLSYLSIQDIVIMGFGCVALVFWLLLFFASSKHTAMFQSLNEKEYPLKDLYGMGYEIMEKISYKYQSKFDRKLRSELSVLYEEKFVEYYLRVVYAQSITLGLLVFVFSFILYGLSSEILILFIGFLMAGLAVYYYMTLSENKIKKRSDELLSDFSEIVSKLALLVNAGMILREAWFDVAQAGDDSVIYKEMRLACDDMNNGVSDAEAVRRFGMRCLIPEIKKFSSTIVQGIEKGNSELASMLQNQSDEIWGMRQQYVKREGAKANSKLMIPMFIMFVGILIMIVIPIFTNLGV